MKVILILLALIGSVLTQGTTKTAPVTNKGSTGTSCGDIKKYSYKQCCKTKIPDFSTNNNCVKSCTNATKEANDCCRSDCKLKTVQKVFANGDSSNKNQKVNITSLLGKILNTCSTKFNQSACKSRDILTCIDHRILIECPDKTNTTTCRKMVDTAKRCTNYTLEKPKPVSSGQPSVQNKTQSNVKSGPAGNVQPNNPNKPTQIQNGTKPSNTTKSSQNVLVSNQNTTNNAQNSIKKPANGTVNGTKTVPAKATILTRPTVKSAQKNSTKSTKPPKRSTTTHASRSANGVLGPNGPAFREA